MNSAGILLLTLCAVGLASCEGGDEGARSEAQYTADNALIRDAAHAMQTIQSRLQGNMKLDGNIIVVGGSLANGDFALARNSSWTISCGQGLSVHFEGAEIDLVSALVHIKDRQCASLAAQTGKAVQAIMDGADLPKS
ncbi:MAG TPA: hypothetical protein VGI20_10860 [Rhizomicrobium sp.]|jgi:hypothetical protein